MHYARAVLPLWLLITAPVNAADKPPEHREQEQSPPQVADPGPHVVKFPIWELQVEGNTLLDDKLVERLVYPFLGPDRTIQDVEAAQQALEAFYRDSGYPTVVVDIPEQDVSQGVVRLKVLQGTVSRVRITGSRYFSLGRIRSGVSALAEGDVVFLPELQQQLKEINRASPDRSITPVFRAGQTPGTVEVELRVKDELPLHGNVELNNRYSRDTSKLRAIASLRYANLWQREHSASLMYQTAPEEPDEVKVWAGTYVLPLGNGSVMAAYLVDSESDVATAGSLSVIGTGTIVGARFVKTLPEYDGLYHSVTFGLDYKDFTDDVVPLDGAGFTTPIDYTNLLAQYRTTLFGDGSKLSFGFSVNFGVRGLTNTSEEFANKRYKAQPNYIYFGAFGDYAYSLQSGMQLYLALDGQLADSPLIDNEQFRAGGVDSVRGYLESQVPGDDGITANLELRSPSFAGKLAHVSDLRLLAFIDASKVRVLKPLPSQASNFELYGGGVGLRITGDQGLSGSLDWAWALKDVEDVDQGDSRAHFNLLYEF